MKNDRYNVFHLQYFYPSKSFLKIILPEPLSFITSSLDSSFETFDISLMWEFGSRPINCRILATGLVCSKVFSFCSPSWHISSASFNDFLGEGLGDGLLCNLSIPIEMKKKIVFYSIMNSLNV